MISYSIYKVIHLTGILALMASLGGLVFIAINGNSPTTTVRKLGAILHGIGIVLILVAGFGMLARLAIPWPYPLWVWIKIIIWLFFAASLSATLRCPKHASRLLWVLLLLGIIAVYLGIYH